MQKYKKRFQKENQTTLDKISKATLSMEDEIKKKKIIIKNIITVFGLFLALITYLITNGWGFMNFGWNSDLNTLQKILLFGGLIIISIYISVTTRYRITAWQIGKTKKKYGDEIEQLETILEERAATFATTVYADDIIAALSKRFTLTAEFVEKFKKIIGNYNWLVFYEFEPDGLELDYLEDKEELLVIEHEKCRYFWITWIYYEDAPFRFFFEKINPDGSVEANILEFALP